MFRSILTALVLAAAAPGVAEESLRTRAELTEFRATSSYADTMDFLEQLAERWPGIRIETFGHTAEGRPMPYVLVSKDRLPRQALHRSGRAIVMIQNGIHAGEIDGKDASLMLLRDLTLGQHRELLDRVVLLIVPIYNIDGHERVSPYNRPNQNGPVEGMGFRTTSDGHDLNRDHLKLVTPEARALIGLVNEWRPHLHVDNHVTNGSDHDWVLTWAWAEAPQIAPGIDAWLQSAMPRVLAETEQAGHRVGPYPGLIDRNDPTRGIDSWVGQPRYATGYYPLRHIPSILVENHSYKPYGQRVQANYDFMLALLRGIARDPAGLIDAVRQAQHETRLAGAPDARPSEVVLRYRSAPATDTVRFPLYAHTHEPSLALGVPLVTYQRGKLAEVEVPWKHQPEVELALPRPRGYVVLPGWPVIEQRLRDHDLWVRRFRDELELDVETIHISNPRQGPRSTPSYQGLTRIDVDVRRERQSIRVPAGSLWVPAAQPEFDVAVQLLEPEAADSLVRWGLLSSVLERKEYIDSRVLEEQVKKMLDDPAIRAEWERALEDETFAADSRARYTWWYRRTPHWDETVGRLPVMRVMKAPDVETDPVGWRADGGSNHHDPAGSSPDRADLGRVDRLRR